MTANVATLTRADFSFLPDVFFTQLDPAKTEAALIRMHEALNGEILYPGHPVRLFLSTLAAALSQRNVIQDQTGKLNMLRYAVGPYLDHIGAWLGVSRLGATAAGAAERFTIASPVAFPVMIPAGTRVTADSKLYFAVKELFVIPAGERFADARVEATTAGADANGMVAGQLNRLVDPLSVVVTVTNLEETAGGAEIEDDDSFRDRIFLAPERFTCAGSGQAYNYFALSSHNNIGDVETHSPTPGVVNVYLLLKNGDIPDTNGPEIMAATATLSDKKIRPLTDKIQVLPAIEAAFDYQFTYWLDARVSGFADVVDSNVRQAAAQYEKWQTTKIGRDLNPDELVRLCRTAGAKRIAPELVLSRDKAGKPVNKEPFTFRKVPFGYVAKAVGDYARVLFGGVENN